MFTHGEQAVYCDVVLCCPIRSVCHSSRPPRIPSKSAQNSVRLADPNSTAPLCQVPKGRNNQEPGTGVPGTDTNQDESRKGRHIATRNPCLFKGSWLRKKCVPSLSGLDHFAKPTRHSRAGLLIVPSPSTALRAGSAGLGAVVHYSLDLPSGLCFAQIREESARS